MKFRWPRIKPKIFENKDSHNSYVILSHNDFKKMIEFMEYLEDHAILYHSFWKDLKKKK